SDGRRTRGRSGPRPMRRSRRSRRAPRPRRRAPDASAASCSAPGARDAVAVCGPAVHLEQTVPEAHALRGIERADRAPRSGIVVLGLPARFVANARLGELLAPDVGPDAVEDQVQRAVAVELL